MQWQLPWTVATVLLGSVLTVGCADPLAVPNAPPKGDCGNGVIEWPEVCDGPDLHGETCRSLGHSGGFLHCRAGCGAFDESQCVDATCGNDRIEGDELCDGFELDGRDCQSLGFDGGTLACRADCSDVSAADCFIDSCGNGLHEPPELCDGLQLAGESCASLGFSGGTLTCLPSCGDFDTSQCEAVGCGNDRRDAGEVCDGTDLGGRTCESLGYAGGPLRCTVDCADFDTGDCEGWPTCGNGSIDLNERCDGDELGGMTCENLGFVGGLLACRDDCIDWDVSGCLGGGELCHNISDDDGDNLMDCEDPSACQYVSPVCISGDVEPAGPCWAHSDCLADDSDPLCFDELQTGIAGGYCTEFCDASTLACVSGGVCVPSSLPSGTGLCFGACNAPQDCRPGQECLFINGVQACLPRCSDDSQCTVMPYCNFDTGLCWPTDETCSDGQDNDDDGAVDCDDLDCQGDPNCGGGCSLDYDIGSDVGFAVASGDTSWSSRNRFQPGCAVGAAPENTVGWTAPAAGTWSFDLHNTAFNAVLSLRLGDCGPELACAADAELPGNAVTVALSAGERVTIIIDGEVVDTGPWVLNIFGSEAGFCDDNLDNDGDGNVDCADPDCSFDPNCGGSGCPEQTLPAVIGAPVTTGTTVGRGDDATPVCGFSNAEDVQIEWTAPFAGTFVIDTFGSSYDTLLHVLSGCGGASLGCNDDSGSLQSQVSVDLSAGQTVLIVVDGWADNAGDYVLNIGLSGGGEICNDGIDNDGDGAADCNDPDCSGDPFCATCPSVNIGPALGTPVATGTNASGPDLYTPSCGRPGASEALIGWIPPWPGRFTLDTFGSSIDTTLSLLAGGCGGVEIDCNDNAEVGTTRSRLTLDLVGGEQLIVVVDGQGAAIGDWALNIQATEAGQCEDGIDNDNDGASDCDDPDCAERPECLTTDCPDVDLGSALGAAVATGSTVGLEDELSPWCAVSTAPDIQFRWTAPSEGTYIFDTFGSDYDTILYAVAGVCGGARLSCNDDAQGLQSRIRLTLSESETVILVVDGFGSSAGDYLLNIVRQ